MNIHNHTPFSSFSFEAVDLRGDRFQIVVVRATFDIVPNKPLRTSSDQEEICLTDDYHGAASTSSLRQEDDLAPFKACSDVIVSATAHAPRGMPTQEWMVGVKVGTLHKRLLVTGPRFWQPRSMGDWPLSVAQPTLCVPLLYENAYGGSWHHDEDAGVYEFNPAGCGHVCKKHLDKSVPLRAPSIVSPDERDVRVNGDHTPQGFGPIAKPWLPRRSYAGSYDEAWKDKRYPLLPVDFNPLFYNCAHPDMLYDGYLNGNEEVRLERLHRDYEVLSFTLPGIRVIVAGEDCGGFRYGTIAQLDTVHIMADSLRVSLIWRAPLLLMDDSMDRIEVMMRDQWPLLVEVDEQQLERNQLNRGKSHVEGRVALA